MHAHQTAISLVSVHSPFNLASYLASISDKGSVTVQGFDSSRT